MLTIKIALIGFLGLFLLSCSNKSEKDKDEIIKQMEESLVNSSQTITNSTQNTLMDLEQASKDWNTMERARDWYPKAKEIHNLSEKIWGQFEEYKKENPSMDIILKLSANYKETIFAIDSSIRLNFKSSVIISNTTSSVVNKELLSSLQNNVKTIENKLVNYCWLKCHGIIESFEVLSAIFSQDSKYLKPGDELEIKAGIGAFSKAGQANIIVDGKKITVSEEGYGTYKIRVPMIPGKYKIPIQISYFSQYTGHDETKKTEVEYTVIKPCNE